MSDFHEDDYTMDTLDAQADQWEEEQAVLEELAMDELERQIDDLLGECDDFTDDFDGIGGEIGYWE